MIKANELRIGNRALYFGKPLIVQSEDFAHLDWGQAEPIPITEEWLKRMGFQFGETIGKHNDDCNNQAWSIQISNLDWLEFQMVKGIDAATMRPTSWPEWRIVNECSYIRQDFWGQPKYIHQLQNLFFALAGEELIIHL